MATVGIIGGIGPESTIDYYRRILAAWSAAEQPGAPSIVINSIDVRRVLHLAGADHAGLTDYLASEVDRLSGAGADFAVLAANTPHVVFDAVSDRVRIPLISIVEATARAAQQRGLRRLALFGTRFTMDGEFYPTVCARHDIAVVLPTPAERDGIHQRYVQELVNGTFRPETRAYFVGVATRLRDEESIDGVVLGGTELPLLLREPDIAGLPALDTTAIHVQAIVDRLLLAT